MSYDTIKNYLKNRLEGLGYIESKGAFNFEDTSANELNKRFILAPVEASIDPDGENLNTRLYDNQLWQVLIPFSKSEHSDVIQRDEMFRSIEAIIKDFDNPSNYLGTVRFIRYESWEVEENENYFLIRINFNIQDQYVY